MTRTQVIAELLQHVYAALDSHLTEAEYDDYIRGNVSFRLDMVLKPKTYFVNVALPSKTNEPKKLEIAFKRRYSRRQGIPVEEAHDAIKA